jgi:predicted SnoaL-like aldol condensation-catalyzing enzyme
MHRRSLFAALAAAPAVACATTQTAQSQTAPAGSDANRAAVTEFIALFYGEKRIREAFERHVVENYIQHNPGALDGRETAIKALEGFFGAFPQMRFEVKRILVDGDLAAVHVHSIPAPGERGFAIIDILRLENGKIVEHWDVIQPVPENPVNPKAMF